MIKILFICMGNICRSPMAEFYMKDLLKKEGLSDQFEIASAATSDEELGNPVYPPARKKLLEHGIDPGNKRARQLHRGDYEAYDILIGMDRQNDRAIRRLFSNDPLGKVHMMLDYANRPGESVADPWYTGDFESTWQDVSAGCNGLLQSLRSEGKC